MERASAAAASAAAAAALDFAAAVPDRLCRFSRRCGGFSGQGGFLPAKEDGSAPDFPEAVFPADANGRFSAESISGAGDFPEVKSVDGGKGEEKEEEEEEEEEAAQAASGVKAEEEVGI